MIVPSLAETASMISPSTMRPVLDRRETREASSSCFLRKRSRNDIQSLGVQNAGRNTSTHTAFGNVSTLHNHAITTNPVVISPKDLVFAWKSQVVIGKDETT